MALDTIAAEVAVAPPVALGANAVAVRERAQDIVRRSQTSLANHGDVSETAIAQLLWGCYGCGWLVKGDRPDACPVCGALAVEFEAFEPFYSRTAEHLGQLPPSEILAILQSGPERVAAAFASLDETQLRTKPSPEEWSPKEIVGHLLEVERLFVRRVQAVLASEPPAMLDTPVPPWKLHIGLGYEDMPALELLVRFRKTREDTVALVAGLQPEDWGERARSAARPSRCSISAPGWPITTVGTSRSWSARRVASGDPIPRLDGNCSGALLHAHDVRHRRRIWPSWRAE